MPELSSNIYLIWSYDSEQGFLNINTMPERGVTVQNGHQFLNHI